MKTIVVDGGSDDGSQELVRSFSKRKVKLIVKPGISEADGQTLAVQNSNSEVIMFTNSDIYVPRKWIRMHVEWLERGFGLVGGGVFWGGDKFTLAWNMPKQSGPKFAQQPGFGLGFSNCSTKREVFTRIGGLASLKSQHDTEFAFRAVRGGVRMILDPEIVVYHDHPFESLSKSFMRSLGYAMNHVLVMRATYGRMVSGEGTPVSVSVGSLIKEWFGITAVSVYRDVRDRALSAGIRVNLLEFVFIRLFSAQLGRMIGVLIGATRRRVTFKSIVELHSKTLGSR